MSKKFLVVLTSLFLSAVSLVAPAQAVTLSPHVYLSDYTPINDQEVSIYVEGLAPNTTYSFGYAFGFDEDKFINWGWLQEVDEIATIQTDSFGRAREEFNWFFAQDIAFDIYSGYLPSHIWVNPIGVIPTLVNPPLAFSDQVIPGQNWGGGNVEFSGAGVSNGAFVSGQQLTISFSNLDSSVQTLEVYLHDESASNSVQEVQNLIFESEYAHGLAGVVGIEEGIGSTTITLPIETEVSSIYIVYYNWNQEDHRGGWATFYPDGSLMPFEERHALASLASKMKPFSYHRVVFGERNFSDTETGWELSTAKGHCDWMGDGLIFSTPGICKWTVTDHATGMVYRGTITVTNKASLRNSVLVEHYSIIFAKNSSKLTAASKKKMRAMDETGNFDNIVAISHTWKEGNMNKSMKIGMARAKAVHDFFESTYGLLGVSTIYAGTWLDYAPLYKKGAKQKLNRRIEIIQALDGSWAW